MKRYVPPVRQQALLHDLAAVVRQLENGDDVELPVFGATNEFELVLRLVGAVSELVRRHPVDDCGRCRHCRPARSGCRQWLLWPTRKAPCLVLSIASFYATVPADHVWLCLLPQLGIKRELSEIRVWLAGRAISAEREPEPVWPSVDEPTQPGATAPVSTIPMSNTGTSSGRHALTA